MTLDNLLRIGKLKAHAADKVEIERLLAAAERALGDASVPSLSADYSARRGLSGTLASGFGRDACEWLPASHQ